MGGREEENSPITFPQMEGDVRCSLQPLSGEQGLDPTRDFPANTTSWRRGGFALLKPQAEGISCSRNRTQQGLSAGKLREKQKSLCDRAHVPARDANRAAPSAPNPTSRNPHLGQS